jgi:hypothetical protein
VKKTFSERNPRQKSFNSRKVKFSAGRTEETESDELVFVLEQLGQARWMKAGFVVIQREYCQIDLN